MVAQKKKNWYLVLQIIPILLYHSIDYQASKSFSPWCIHPERFEEHMAFLSSQGYQTRTVTQLSNMLHHKEPLPQKLVLITFDDGFKDFYSYALPILKKYALKATLYITSGLIGSSSIWLQHEGEGLRPLLSWEQIQEIHSEGIECGAHTLSHPELDIISAKKAKYEILNSKLILEEKLQAPIESFAYPHGYYSTNTQKLVKSAGFTSACAVKNALSTTQDDIFALARIDVRSHVDTALLHNYLETDIIPITSSQESIQTRLWRYARQMRLHKSQTFSKLLESQIQSRTSHLFKS